jgi:hypothetical protein
MRVNLGELSFDWKFKFLSDILYEDITEKSFKGDTEKSWLIYFYCNFLACTENYEVTLEDFLKVLDENPAALYEFISFYTKYQTNMMNLMPKDKEQYKKKVNKKKKSK